MDPSELIKEEPAWPAENPPPALVVPLTLEQEVQMLKNGQKRHRKGPRVPKPKSDVPPMMDSSDSDHIIDRKANARAASAASKKRRRRRRRNSQKLTRKSTPGILDTSLSETIEEVSDRPAKRSKLSDVVRDADAGRIAGTVQNVPTVKPITDAIASFAMAARVSSRTMRREIAQGIGDAVDADLQQQQQQQEETSSSDIRRSRQEDLDMPDEFKAFFSDYDTSTEGKGSVVWKILMDEEEKRDRNYRKPSAQYYSAKLLKGDGDGDLTLPDLGPSCSKSYCRGFLEEPIQLSGPMASLERPCVRGRSGCVAMFLPQTWPDTLQTAKPEAGFVMKEFYRPDQWKKIVREGKLPEQGRMCLFCYRWTTTRASFAMRARGISVPWMQGTVIQDHWNTISESGGYTNHDMIPMTEDKPGQWTGLIKPFVMWRSNRYECSTRERTMYDEDEGCEVTVTVRCYVERDQDF